MLEFNVGELTTRLRRALAVRGRMAMGLEEYVIGTVQTANVSGAPFRTNPVFGQAAAYTAIATAGRYAQIKLEYPSAYPGIRELDASVFVVTGWMLQPLNFVTASGAAASQNTALAIFKPGGAGVTAGQPLISTERLAASGTSLSPYQLPVHLQTANTPSLPPAGTDPGILQWVRSGVVQPPAFVPTETLLRPGDLIEFWSTVPADATHTSALALTVQGLLYGLG